MSGVLLGKAKQNVDAVNLFDYAYKLQSNEQFAEAYLVWQKEVEREKTAATLFNLALCHLYAKEFETAILLLEETYNTNPD